MPKVIGYSSGQIIFIQTTSPISEKDFGLVSEAGGVFVFPEKIKVDLRLKSLAVGFEATDPG